jgi:hypothetical protein
LQLNPSVDINFSLALVVGVSITIYFTMSSAAFKSLYSGIGKKNRFDSLGTSSKLAGRYTDLVGSYSGHGGGYGGGGGGCCCCGSKVNKTFDFIIWTKSNNGTSQND